MPSRAELSIYQGDSYAATVTVRTVTGAEADITGYAATAQIRLACADVSPVVAEIACVVDSPNVNLSLTPEQTVELAGNYQWDLQIISPAGIVTTILAGRVRVTAEVTRLVVAA